MDAALQLLWMILEFVVSYFLKERKSGRISDELRRKREMADLVNLVNSHRRLAAEFYTTHSQGGYDKLWVMDKKIEEEGLRAAELITNDRSTPEERNEEFMKLINLCEELQMHINTLINQTYQ